MNNDPPASAVKSAKQRRLAGLNRQLRAERFPNTEER